MLEFQKEFPDKRQINVWKMFVHQNLLE